MLERLSADTIPFAAKRQLAMMFCRDANGRVAAVRATESARGILEAADGMQSLEALARMAGLAHRRAEALAEILRKLGALV